MHVTCLYTSMFYKWPIIIERKVGFSVIQRVHEIIAFKLHNDNPPVQSTPPDPSYNPGHPHCVLDAPLTMQAVLQMSAGVL